MSIFSLVQGPGEVLHIGLSTDTKPPVSSNGAYLAADTGQFFRDSSGDWAPVLKHISVASLSDFPAPVSGVITLQDDTAYLISGTVDIGTNRIVVGIRNTIKGTDRQNDILTSSTTGTMFTMDNSGTPKVSLIFDNLTLRATAGTLISATGGTTDQVTFITTSINTTLTGGTFSGVAFSMRTSSITSLTTAGFTFTGSNVSFTLRDSSVTGNTGTLFNLSSATVTNVVRIGRNFISTPASQTFLNATGIVLGIAGQIALNVFTGSGTAITGITESTSPWLFSDNQGITNTPVTSTAPNIATSQNQPSGTETILANTSGFVVGSYAIPDGFVLDIASGAVFSIF